MSDALHVCGDTTRDAHDVNGKRSNGVPLRSRNSPHFVERQRVEIDKRPHLPCVTKRRVVQMRDTGNFRLPVTALTDTGEMSQVTARGTIALAHGHYITITGEGFRPGAEVVAWLFSTPRRLGNLSVAADGTFKAELLIDSTVEIGAHTAQVNGYTSTGELRSLNLAVEVLEPQALPAKSTDTRSRLQWMFLGALLVLAMGAVSLVFWPLYRRRRQPADG